jgi:hypothetical protein
VALSATVVAVSPGVAWSLDGEARSPGWTAASVRFEPLGPSGPLSGVAAPGLTVAGTGTYRGTVEVRPNGRGLAVVNELGLEDYVRGIDEVPPSWPAAVLQAQAIAARTYAAHKAAATDATPWRAVGADICATSTCQVYRGLDAERKAQGSGWLPAVEATAGRALIEGGRPIMASYSATANGPRAMSQNGAMAMALEGRSANEILTAYYGIGPTLAPKTLPATIRVALGLTSSSVRVAAAAPFRVVAGDGTELAAAAAGEWKVVPAAGGVGLEPAGGDLRRAATPTSAPATEIRRPPGRVITAAAPTGGRGPWPITAAALALGAGAAVVLHRRRRARTPGAAPADRG